MRLCYSVMLLCFASGMMMAEPATGQNMKEARVSLQVKNSSLKTVIKELEDQTGFMFTYKNDIRPGKIRLNIDAPDNDLEEVLEMISKGSSLKFLQINNMIAVRMKNQKPVLDENLLERYGGVVYDRETNESLPGVTVLVKGTSSGTITDENGNFSLEAEPGQTLVFSSIGFAEQEVVLGNTTALSIYLLTDARELDEFVVVGFGEQKKVNLTGAVEMVTSEDLENRPVTSIANLMQGMMPGVTVQSHSGMPGQTPGSVRIRGLSTINNQNPLVIIDGIEGDMNILNPDDIESISVLKDAASASIYGSRGANGVILITTKSGKKAESPSISINSYYGVQQPTAMPRFLGSVDYMHLQNEAMRNSGRSDTYTEEDIQRVIDGTDPNFSANTNWIDAIFKDYAPQQSHMVSITGGGDNLGYLLSYGYLDQEGLVVGDAFSAKRNNIRLKLNTTFLDVVDVVANIGYIDRNTVEPQWSTSATGGVIQGALQISPLVPVRYTNGEWGYGGGANNPVAIATDGGSNILTSQEFTGNFTGNIKLHKNLNVKGQYGMVMTNSKRSIFVKRVEHRHPDTDAFLWANVEENSMSMRDHVTRYQNVLAQMDYSNQWGDHSLQGLLAFQQEWQEYETHIGGRRDFINIDIPALNLGTNPLQTSGGDAYHWALRSGIARINYDYKGKYLLEINSRYDGSSRFAKDNRFGFFPSASAGWRFTDEDFLQGIQQVIYDGKFRASYGGLGNQFLRSSMPAYSQYYAYVPVLNSVGTMPIGNDRTAGFAQTVSSSPNLSWETVQMLNLGLDLYFLEGKLSVTADWFNKQTKDIILRVPQPSVLGITESDINAGAVENKGWELNVNWSDQIRDFTYRLNAQVSDVKNKVLSMGDTPPAFGTQVNIVGYPIGSFYGLVANRLAQPSDFDEAGNPTIPVFDSERNRYAPGDLVYEDLNGDGRVTMEDDRQVLGNPFPRYTYSFRGDFTWKGFDLAIFFQGVGKAVGYVYENARHAFMNNSMYPQEIHLDRYTPDNPGASYPRFNYGETYNMRVSSYWLEDASYLRLKNLQIGYTLPPSLLQKYRINRLRVYFSGDNLLTRTNFFYGYDPESPLTRGGFYPQVKTYVMGVNINLK